MANTKFTGRSDSYIFEDAGGKRDQLAAFLRENDIYTTFRYFPLNRVKHYDADGNFPESDYASDNTLCLPVHQSLTNDEVNYICDKIIEYGKKYV